MASALWQLDFFSGPPAPIAASAGPLDRAALLARTLPPPFVPRLSSPLDTSYFAQAVDSDDDDDDTVADINGRLHYRQRPSDTTSSTLPTVLVVEQPAGDTQAALLSTGARPAESSNERVMARLAQRDREMAISEGARSLGSYVTYPCESADAHLVPC